MVWQESATLWQKFAIEQRVHKMSGDEANFAERGPYSDAFRGIKRETAAGMLLAKESVEFRRPPWIHATTN